MKTGKYFFAGLLLLVACAGDSGRSPLPVNTMVEVLQEFHMAKAGIDTDHNNAKYRKAETDILYAAILKQYDLDTEAFAYSYSYYLDDPVQLDTIYARVIRGLNDKMQEQEAEVTRIKTTDPSRANTPSTPITQPLPDQPNKTKRPASSPAFQTPADDSNRAR